MNKTMKLRLLTFGLCLAAVATFAQGGLNNKISTADPKIAQFVFVSCVSGTSIPAASSKVPSNDFTAATFYGIKATTNNAAPTTNITTVYIGFYDYDNSRTNIVDSITSGSWLSLKTTGAKYNLADFYFLGTNTDKVLIVYER